MYKKYCRLTDVLFCFLEPKTYANMVSKNASSSTPQSLPVTSNTTSPVSNLPPAHKTEQPSTYKAEGTPVSAGQVNRDKSEGVNIIFNDIPYVSRERGRATN